MDRNIWEQTNHNPVELLGSISQERLKELADDDSFVSQLNNVIKELDRYTSEDKLYEYNLVEPIDFTIAYFSMEYGILESVPIYSGGLGILAGDHLKSASDLSIPLVGIGLCYQEGYFRQYLNNDAWQQETFAENDLHNMPLELITDEQGKPIEVSIQFPGRPVKVHTWKLQVGRTRLYLLDTNLKDNLTEDRNITSQLYGGNREMRLKQEIILGIGGTRMLKQLGIEARVFHMNEGHSAFTSLERARILIQEHKVTFEEAREAVSANSIFTTHTPVPAGIDTFHSALMETYFQEFSKELGISFKEFLALGRENPNNEHEMFSMAILAIRMSSHYNGVSQLHRDISRDMWKTVWPEVLTRDIPIIHVTNGVHIPSWTSIEMQDLFTRYLGPRWQEDPDAEKVWDRINNIPDSELWRTHERRRERLVAFCRRRLEQQLVRRGATVKEVSFAKEILNPEALTIGFARRFATYKRGNLLLRDIDRLMKILSDDKRPVQFIFAGKAHPQDQQGKELIRNLVHFMRDEKVRFQMVFIEDYDMNVARYMVQGVDIWLNNPRRPLEACGTSGMKSTANGALNVSVLDGWWVEGYDPNYGWCIGHGEEYLDVNYQDDIESQALYDILEKDVIPLFYERGFDNMPRLWIAMMKRSMANLCYRFNSHRMLEEYMEKFYHKSAKTTEKLYSNRLEGARELAAWKKKMQKTWGAIEVKSVKTQEEEIFQIGREIQVNAEIFLGDVDPKDLNVNLYHGPLNSQGEYVERFIKKMDFKNIQPNGNHLFTGTIPCNKSGKFGFNLQILPYHPNLIDPLEMHLIIWE